MQPCCLGHEDGVAVDLFGGAIADGARVPCMYVLFYYILLIFFLYYHFFFFCYLHHHAFSCKAFRKIQRFILDALGAICSILIHLHNYLYISRLLCVDFAEFIF